MNNITEKSRITVSFETVYKNSNNEVVRASETRMVTAKKAATLIWMDNAKFENKGIPVSLESIRAFT